MEPPRTVTTNIRFPKDVHEQLAALAKRQRRSINQAVVFAVEQYLQQEQQPKAAPDAQ
jgi:predicted HicB family RNase H-like nuclease